MSGAVAALIAPWVTGDAAQGYERSRRQAAQPGSLSSKQPLVFSSWQMPLVNRREGLPLWDASSLSYFESRLLEYLPIPEGPEARGATQPVSGWTEHLK